MLEPFLLTLAAPTDRYAKFLLGGVFKFAIRRGYVIVNPLVDCYDLGGYVKPESRHLSRPEFARLLRETEGVEQIDELVLLRAQGLRLGEARMLRWSDIDLDNAVITVKHGGSRSSRGTKTGKSRKVTLAPSHAERLRKVKARQAETAIPHGESPVVRTLAGGEVSESWLGTCSPAGAQGMGSRPRTGRTRA